MNPYFSTRRSIRAYDPDRPVSDELLSDLLGQAIQAPNTGNMQIYSVIVTREPERLAAIAPAHFSQPRHPQRQGRADILPRPQQV